MSCVNAAPNLHRQKALDMPDDKY